MSVSLSPPPDAPAPVPAPEAPAPGTVLPPHFAHCFGCGPEHPTGLRLAVTVADGVAIDAVFSVTDAHQGAPGLAHGGVLATAADEALGFLNALLRLPAVTARLEVDYLRPVPVGTDLHLHAQGLAVVGRKIYVRVEGRLDSPQGLPAIRGAGLFLTVPLSHFAQHAGGAAPGPSEGAYNP